MLMKFTKKTSNVTVDMMLLVFFSRK